MVEADSVMSPTAAPPAPMNVMIGPILVAKISAAIAIQNEPDRSIEMEALLTTTGGVLLMVVYATSLVCQRLDAGSTLDEVLISPATKSEPHVTCMINHLSTDCFFKTARYLTHSCFSWDFLNLL